MFRVILSLVLYICHNNFNQKYFINCRKTCWKQAEHRNIYVSRYMLYLLIKSCEKFKDIKVNSNRNMDGTKRNSKGIVRL